MHRSKIIILLILFFLLSTYRETLRLFEPESDSSYHICAALEWLAPYYAGRIGLVVLLAATSCSLIWPRPVGFWVAQGTLLYLFGTGVAAYYLLSLDTESAVIALTEASKHRPREITEDAARYAMTSGVMDKGIASAAVFDVFLSILLFWRRKHFSPSASEY